MQPAFRRILTTLALPALALGTLAAGAAPSAHAHARSASSQPVPSRRGTVPPAAPAWLASERARAKAEATGKPVIVSALTTASSVTRANPDGTFTLDQSLLPERARRDGAWEALDPTLHADPGGRVSPSLTTSGVTLSGGGTRPLAVLSSTGHSMSLSWPGSLPAPSLSGSTATYHNVLPGVDLQMAVSGQGAVSTMLVVKNAAAAANPALASLRLTTSTPSLHLAPQPGGGVAVTAGPKAVPVFNVQAAQVWDSAAPPTGTATTATRDGTTVTADSGLPTYSSPSGPGAFAHVASVPLTVSGHTLTMAPPPSALTGPKIVYPVYIDPTIYSDPVSGTASAWTQVDSAWPSQTYWKESSDLQAGLCDWASCNSTFKARSFIRMPLSSDLKGATINYSDLYMTDVWAASCTAESVQLWTTGGINSSTDWSNQPPWDTQVQSKSFAYGFSSSCPYKQDDVTWNIKSVIQGDVSPASSFKSTQVFGLRADSETNDLYWKKFWDGTHNNTASIHMSTSYNLPPNAPASLSTNPGGACQTSQANAAQIGNNDVTFSAYVLDQDGDSNLSTRFVIYNSGGSVAYDSAAQNSNVTTGNNTTAPLLLTRTQMQALNGTSSQTQAYLYYWRATTTDTQSSGSSLTSSWSSGDCWFTYNPQGPAAPTVTPSFASGQIGKSFTVSFAPPSTGCGGATTPPCPVSYTYQLGADRPVTVTADSSSSWTNGTIPIRRIGPMLLTVYATDSSGNVSPQASIQVTGTAPATSYADGDFNGDGQPDVLTVGTGANSGLWLLPGSGPGTLGRAVDIGGAGTGINSSGSPADWTGAQVLHGNFTSRGVQDLMAYYPSGTNAGAGQMIDGTGDGSMLAVNANTVVNIPPAGPGGPAALADPFFANSSDVPIDLVAAGNASEAGDGNADLIGILGDAANGYELNLYTTAPGSTGTYGYDITLSTTAQGPPGQAADPNSDWSKYQLVTVQLPDAAYPGGDPSDTALFALDTVNGDLYESTNAGCGTASGCSATATIGTVGTWQQLQVPWGSATPNLVSADLSVTGYVELWASNGATATPYSVSGTTVTAKTATAVSQPSHEWPIAEGTGTTATDATGGDSATLTGTAQWGTADSQQIFTPSLMLDGSTASLAGIGPAINTSQSYTVSAWVNLNTVPNANGVPVLPAHNEAAAAQDGTTDNGFDLGYNYAHSSEWCFFLPNSDTTSPSFTNACSPTVATGATWNHLVGVYDATAQTATLYVNNVQVASVSYTSAWNATGTFTIGRGQYNGSAVNHLNGTIADVQTWQSALTAAQVTATGGITGAGPALSGLSGKCLDDYRSGTADGNVIDIYDCIYTRAQEWTVDPGDTLQVFGKCLNVTGGGTTSGTLVDLSHCDNSGAQQWIPGANGSLINPASGMCLDDPGSSTVNGTQLQIYGCNGTSAQRWALP